MRDHRKLRAFQLADELALAVYRDTQRFPGDERFGLTSQMRRAAVSIASNIVEGCARATEADYLRFLDMSNASARELEYQIGLAARLGFFGDASTAPDCVRLVGETNRTLAALLRSLRHPRRQKPEA
ncbi:four helix bundle protein [Botrimarina sp.]|uniref:four helix bundle protein n=1 Tax=Botrimarina sp. TaxID=2795802 RepID=UPI0032ED0533